MDGTSGRDVVDAGVFASTMNDLAAHAREADATDVKLVFLGDVFDLWRSERWFDYPLEARPWGDAPSEEAVTDVFEGVLAANAEMLELVSGSVAERFGFPVEPERIFVPGNHDRLVNASAALRRRARESLGISPAADDEPLPHHVLDEEHGLFARHGHEWDQFSFAGSPTLDAGEEIAVPPEDYRPTAIGDVMACEFACRLAPLVARELGPDHPSVDSITEQMRTVTDVRPVQAAMQWAAWQATQFDDRESEAVNAAIRVAARDVREIPFVRRWIESEDEWGLDRADLFQMLVRALGSLELMDNERILGFVDNVSSGQRDIDAHVPAREFERLDRHPGVGENIYYVLYGHTHEAVQRPVALLGRPPEVRYRVYFNTGTWRPVHRPLTYPAGAFASWREMTYVLVYRPGERGSSGSRLRYPAVESWTGVAVGPGGERHARARLATTAGGMADERSQMIRSGPASP